MGARADVEWVRRRFRQVAVYVEVAGVPDMWTGGKP